MKGWKECPECEGGGIVDDGEGAIACGLKKLTLADRAENYVDGVSGFWTGDNGESYTYSQMCEAFEAGFNFRGTVADGK